MKFARCGVCDAIIRTPRRAHLFENERRDIVTLCGACCVYCNRKGPDEEPFTPGGDGWFGWMM